LWVEREPQLTVALVNDGSAATASSSVVFEHGVA
jgi:hypothetical protein